MAAPNMLQLNTINGDSSSLFMSSMAEFDLLSNAAASNAVIKVNAVYVSNTSGSTDTITLSLHNAAAIGGTAFPIASTVSVPANSTIVLIDKDANLYLSENTSLGVTSSAGGSASCATVSYERCL
jgi:hypothetical protein